MNIALVVESFPTISETFITNKVLELCKRGHNITVIRNSNGHEEALVQLYGLHSIPNLNIVSVNIPTTIPTFIFSLLQHPLAVFKAVSKKGSFKTQYRYQLYLKVFQQTFDIVHFEFSGLGVVYQPIMKYIKAATVVSCRGTAEKVKPFTEPGRKEQLQLLFTSVDAIHCVSQDMVETIRQYCNSSANIFVNRPSIDITYFQRTLPKPNNKTFQILSIGRFTFQKGYLIGLMAAQQMKAAGVDFVWHIVGDGPLREAIIFHIHTLGLQNQVKLLGKKNRNEVFDLYQQADVFLLSSVYEGIANVVLEAMAMELPVVSTKSGGLEEVIESGVDGFLADVYNHEQLATQLMQLQSNATLRESMGQKARQKIEAAFTINRQASEFEQQYRHLIQR
jgi:colanic acid/amylovoran biosynthesis glycosyltransferase